jgi:hypothetical protein
MEYSSKKLTEHLKAGGTLAEVTTLYTPEQNGVAERAIRTVWSKVRVAIEDSNLPKELWLELCFCYSYYESTSYFNT